MPRTSPDDWPQTHAFGWRKCPVCGDTVTNNARGFKSHVEACKKRVRTFYAVRMGKDLWWHRTFEAGVPTKDFSPACLFNLTEYELKKLLPRMRWLCPRSRRGSKRWKIVPFTFLLPNLK